jgi:xanthine/CO dehydrogenase XdhC/CoxF family maturation factor
MTGTVEQLDTALSALAAGRPAALATVVAVDGSAYRREGATLVVTLDEDGVATPHGLISGGCLEGEVAQIAAEVIGGGARRETFDMRDDALFGLGSGCGGVVDVLIEPLADPELLRAWLAALAERRALVRALVSRASGAAPLAASLLVSEGGEAQGSLVATPLGAEVEARARALLSTDSDRAVVESLGDAELLLVPQRPSPKLLLFGAGIDARPVAELADRSGFSVTVVDPRRGLLTPEAFPGAELHAIHPGGYDATLAVDGATSVVVMNHHFERDRAALRFALERGVGFVGVLGPRHRFERLLAELADEGFVPGTAQLTAVRNPVGLDLGAVGPEQIALSIVAQLLAERRGRAGGSLAKR